MTENLLIDIFEKFQVVSKVLSFVGNLVQSSSYLDSTVHLKVMFSVQVGMTGVQVYKVLSIGQSSRMQI